MTTTKLFKIDKIHCASCVMLLEALEDDVKGVQNVKVDLGRKLVSIELDDKILDEKTMIKEIKKISGYEAILYVN